MTNIAIFASGSGTNAENIINYFKTNNYNIEVCCIITNNPNAFVIQRAEKLNIPCYVIDKKEFTDSSSVYSLLIKYRIDFIVLAGFLLLIPESLINQFPNRIINIHPALLPDFGGKGMYGINVHRKVKESNARKSGISIHFVTKNYDEGKLVFQAECEVNESDTAEDIAEKIHQLEYLHYPSVIRKIIEAK
jgi:phosphoribosylglycinamide formyltransferase 1